VKIAHREQVELLIELDDLAEIDPDFAQRIVENTRRYSKIFSEAIDEMLPNYKDREIQNKDSLDVYIEHRLLIERQNHREGEVRDPRDRYPPELLRRL
ncbi:DNA replication licensing factor mcm7, partial [Paramuricea clavata]